MTIKKILISIATILFVALVVFAVYAQTLKMKFDKIYAKRESEYIYHKYDDLYRSGALNRFRDFVLQNYDTISSKYELGLGDIRYRIEIWSQLSILTKDSSVLYAMEEISKYRFYDVYIEDDKKNDSIVIEFEKMFLQYKLTPTYHCIIYSKDREYEYRFDENDSWFFFTVDDNEHDLGHFMDLRPEWSLPYFEAFEFFKRYPDFELD